MVKHVGEQISASVTFFDTLSLNECGHGLWHMSLVQKNQDSGATPVLALRSEGYHFGALTPHDRQRSDAKESHQHSGKEGRREAHTCGEKEGQPVEEWSCLQRARPHGRAAEEGSVTAESCATQVVARRPLIHHATDVHLRTNWTQAASEHLPELVTESKALRNLLQAGGDTCH